MDNNRLIEVLNKTISILETKKHSVAITGVCDAIHWLWIIDNEITSFEYRFARKYLSDNQPTKYNQYRKFTENDFWMGHNKGVAKYWWLSNTADDNDKMKQIRIDYLKALISNIK